MKLDSKDLLRLSSLKANLYLKSRMIRTIRRFFDDQGFLEVETPLRQPTQAPEAHIDAEKSGDWFLQTSPELCMKRLLSAGYDRIFQVCRCFRKGERGDRHLPEFTMLEWYCTDFSLFDLMEQCEDLIRAITHGLGKDETLSYQGMIIRLEKPWSRLTVSEAFLRHAAIPVEEALSSGRFDEITGFDIEPELGHDAPVFLYDYPASLGSLARIDPGNPNCALRFELYIGGMELCNAFSELTDPEEQRLRFEKELAIRDRLRKTAYPMPEKFLKALKFMPEAAGCAMGIDRLAMLFTDAKTIDEVTAFTPETL